MENPYMENPYMGIIESPYRKNVTNVAAENLFNPSNFGTQRDEGFVAVTISLTFSPEDYNALVDACNKRIAAFGSREATHSGVAWEVSTEEGDSVQFTRKEKEVEEAKEAVLKKKEISVSLKMRV